MITLTFLLTISLGSLKKKVLLSNIRPKLKIREKCFAFFLIWGEHGNSYVKFNRSNQP